MAGAMAATTGFLASEKEKKSSGKARAPSRALDGALPGSFAGRAARRLPGPPAAARAGSPCAGSRTAFALPPPRGGLAAASQWPGDS